MTKKTYGVINSYAVVTLYKSDEVVFDPEVNMFLEPGANVEAHCAYYLGEGYVLFNVWECSHEEWLNAQVNVCVHNYLDTDDEFESLRHKFRTGKLTLEDYLTARELVFESINSYLRGLYDLFSELDANDYDVENELAIALYNAYF